jgi:predicted RNA binding protein YcfA (HicA-like mRNA interferase family)
VKLRTLEQHLARQGWCLNRINGSHRVYHRDGQQLVLAAHPGEDVRRGTCQEIARRARRLDEALNTAWLYPESQP